MPGGVAMKRKFIYFFILIFLFSMIDVGVSGESLIISGSNVVRTYARKVGDIYNRNYNSNVYVKGGNSEQGVKDAITGNADIGMVSRELKEYEKKNLNYITVGYGAIAIIVNECNPIKAIDSETLIKIYTGEITNWKKVTGWDEPIVVVSRGEGESELEKFEEYTGLNDFLKSEPGPNGYIDNHVYRLNSALQTSVFVAGVPGAIGYCSAATVKRLRSKGLKIKSLLLDGVELNEETILQRTYPMLEEINFIYFKKMKRLKDILMRH